MGHAMVATSGAPYSPSLRDRRGKVRKKGKERVRMNTETQKGKMKVMRNLKEKMKEEKKREMAKEKTKEEKKREMPKERVRMKGTPILKEVMAKKVMQKG